MNNSEEEKKKPKDRYVAPNLTEYYLDQRGFVRRVDLRGAGTRAEQKRAKRIARNARKKRQRLQG